MLRLSLLASVFTLAALPVMAADAPPTADSIIAAQLKARGGAEALASIKTLKFEGTLIFPGDFKLDVVEVKTRPGMVRTDATIQGLDLIQAYDGKVGWQVQPFSGRKDAEVLSADDIKDMLDDDIVGPLYDYQARGGKVEYLGTEDVDGTATHKLRLTEKSGDQLTYFIDTDSMMTIRILTKRILRGREQLTVTDYGDYEKVGGFYFPFENESAPPGVNDKQKTIYVKGSANGPVDDAVYHLPVSAK